MLDALRSLRRGGAKVYHHALVLVQLVNGESPATVTTNGHLLSAVAQLIGGAVAVCAGALVVVGVHHRDGVDVDGVNAVPLIVLVGDQIQQRFAAELFVSIMLP